MNTDARDRVDQAIARLLMQYPFWGALILGLEVEESDRFQTMVTNGVHLFYNAEYVLQQDREILCTDVAHKAGHKAFGDSFRRGDRDPKIWNAACDFRINYFLKNSGIKLGHDFLYDPKFDGWDAEEIYDFLVTNPNSPQMQQVQQKGGCGCGGLQDHPQAAHEPGDEQGEGQGAEAPGQGEEGSAGPAGAPTLSLPESDNLLDLAQARQFARKQGNLPGLIDGYVEGIVNPKIRWQDELQRFMEECDAADWTWLKPQRHMLAYNVYLPTLESEGVDTFVIAVDTSGSTISYMQQFLAEVSACAKTLNFRKLYVLYHDTRVYHVDEYERGDTIEPLRTQKRGGTNFVPVFNWLEENLIDPKGMVFLTDTYGSFPPAPTFPVLWVVPEKETGASVEFGEMIRIS